MPSFTGVIGQEDLQVVICLLFTVAFAVVEQEPYLEDSISALEAMQEKNPEIKYGLPHILLLLEYRAENEVFFTSGFLEAQKADDGTEAENIFRLIWAECGNYPFSTVESLRISALRMMSQDRTKLCRSLRNYYKSRGK